MEDFDDMTLGVDYENLQTLKNITGITYAGIHYRIADLKKQGIIVKKRYDDNRCVYFLKDEADKIINWERSPHKHSPTILPDRIEGTDYYSRKRIMDILGIKTDIEISIITGAMRKKGIFTALEYDKSGYAAYYVEDAEKILEYKKKKVAV